MQSQYHHQQGGQASNDHCMPALHAVSQSASAMSVKCLVKPVCRTTLAACT